MCGCIVFLPEIWQFELNTDGGGNSKRCAPILLESLMYEVISGDFCSLFIVFVPWKLEGEKWKMEDERMKV